MVVTLARADCANPWLFAKMYRWSYHSNHLKHFLHLHADRMSVKLWQCFENRILETTYSKARIALRWVCFKFNRICTYIKYYLKYGFICFSRNRLHHQWEALYLKMWINHTNIIVNAMIIKTEVIFNYFQVIFYIDIESQFQSWLSISSQFDSNILQLLGIPGWILVTPVTQLFRSKWFHFFFQCEGTIGSKHRRYEWW